MNQRAFTLIELLVVVAIVGILAAVGTVAYTGYTSGAKKVVVKKQHREVVNYIKTELVKCDIGFDYVMGGHLDCSDKNTTNEIANATVKAFDKKFNNPWKSWISNSVAVGLHADKQCFTYNYGGVVVSNVDSGSSTLVRVSTCHGEEGKTAILEGFIID